ncbi:MAG: hypothetical protein H0Z38_08190 [Firmicutes bacterium]|nr:hypothetical protein [Bacillota bacterium]
MSKIIKSIFIPEENKSMVVRIPIPDAAELKKATNLTKPLPPLTKEEEEKQAADILAQAQEEAALLLQQAREEAEAIKETARKEGFSQGLAEGQKAAQEELQALRSEFQKVTEEIYNQLAAERREIISGASEDLLKLILLFAEKIIRTTISLDPKLLGNLLASALEKVEGAARIEVRLHPEDLNIIEELDGENELTPGSAGIELIPDPRLPRYSCLVNTSKVSVDASLETQLAELEEALRKALLKEVNPNGS